MCSRSGARISVRTSSKLSILWARAECGGDVLTGGGGAASVVTNSTVDGVQEWSNSYNGKLADVFDLQESCAHDIATRLKVVLGDNGRQQLVDRSTDNADAYALFVEAQTLVNARVGDSLRYLGQKFGSGNTVFGIILPMLLQAPNDGRSILEDRRRVFLVQQQPILERGIGHVIGVLDHVIARGLRIPSGSAASPHYPMLGRGRRDHVPSRTFVRRSAVFVAPSVAVPQTSRIGSMPRSR